jgi:hypothetical protein
MRFASSGSRVGDVGWGDDGNRYPAGVCFSSGTNCSHAVIYLYCQLTDSLFSPSQNRPLTN